MAYRLKQTGQEVQELLDKMVDIDPNMIVEELGLVEDSGSIRDLIPINNRILVPLATQINSGLLSATDKTFIHKIKETIGGGADNFELGRLDFGEAFPLGGGSNTEIYWCSAHSEDRENEGIVLSTCDPDSEMLDIPQFQLLIAPYGIFKRKTANGTWSEWETLGETETATSAEMVTIWNGTNNN